MGLAAAQDYEEGSFTLTIGGLITAGSHIYNIQLGRYIKIGRTVHFVVEVRMSVKDESMDGYVSIMGLPFIATRNQAVAIGRVDFLRLPSDGKSISSYVRSISSRIDIKVIVENSNDKLLDSSLTSK